MRAPSGRVGGLVAGSIVQVPALAVLLRAVFDMHNRFSVGQSLLLPYAAIADRLHHPSPVVMAIVLVVTLFQFPLYGVLLGHAWTKGRLVVAIVGVALVHGVAGGIAIYMKMANM